MIAFYYGLTGFSCVWYYRSTLRESARNLWMRGILPLLGGLILLGCMVYNFWHYWNPVNSYTTWTLPLPPRWQIGGVFLLDVVRCSSGSSSCSVPGHTPGLLPGRGPQP